MKKYWMLAFRAVYLIAIIAFAAFGHWVAAWFNGVCFLGSLFIPYLGRKDDQYYVLDCFVVSVFLLSLIPSYFNSWYVPTDLYHLVFGFDKLFHMAAGACMGMFAAILLRRRVKGMTFYLGIAVFALAMGGAWEIFEWFASILPAPWTLVSQGYADSMLDMVADTVGAMILALVLWKMDYLKKK